MALTVMLRCAGAAGLAPGQQSTNAGAEVNFFEYCFRISPDHGTGSTELLFLVLVAAALLLRTLRVRLKDQVDRTVLPEPGRSPGSRAPIES
jgi:hypothetical protein